MANTIKSTKPILKVNGIPVNGDYISTRNCGTRTSRQVSYVVVHYTGNSADTALNNAKYFSTGIRGASAHYFVDDSSIFQSVAAKDVAWHCGTTGKYYNNCRNSYSLGVEMCCSGNYLVSAKTIENAAYLCASLCELLNIPATSVDTYVVRHYDVTHKNCPAQFVDNPAEWTAFKAKVKSILNGGTATKGYSQKDFIKEIQQLTGSEVDGIAGKETLSNTVTVSATINRKHSVVKPIQKRLNALGYNCGSVDGIAGSKFTAAVKTFQRAQKCVIDGEITARGRTWRRLLGMG